MKTKIAITGEVAAIEDNPNLELTHLTVAREMPSGTTRTFDIAIASREVTCKLGDFVTVQTAAFIPAPTFEQDQLVINVQYVATSLATH